MRYAYDDDQKAVAETARALLAHALSSSTLRSMSETVECLSTTLWRELCDTGLIGILAPEHHGGGGGSLTDFAAFAEEAGRVLLPGPWLETGVLAITMVSGSDNERAKERWLPDWAAGRAMATLAYQSAEGGPFAGVTAKRQGGNHFAVRGTKTLVPYAHVVDAVVVTATLHDEPAVLVVPLSAGVSVQMVESVDVRERLCTVTFDAVVDSDSLLFCGNGASGSVDRMLALATTIRCVEMLGAARAVLDRTVDYARTRQQFGQEIGAFQAVKHHLASAATRVENMAAVVYWALWDVQQDRPSASAVAVAKAYSSVAYIECCRTAVQVHGAIGFTWEADVHLYLKHARRCASTFGTASHHLETLASWLLDAQVNGQTAS